MENRKLRYRLEVNYYSKDYDNRCCETSSPIYTLADGWKEYKKAIKEKCIDNPGLPARVHLWKYDLDAFGSDGWYHGDELTIARNY